MEQITFPINQPVKLVLKYSDGFNRPNNIVSFTLVDNRKMFVPRDVSDSIKALKIQAGEPFTIEKKSEPAGKHSWVVARLDLQSELDSASKRGAYGVRPAPVSPFPPPAPGNRPTAPEARGTGTNGPALKPIPVSGKIPANQALGEILDFVNGTLAARNEEWDVHSKQALICTLWIQADRAGRIGPWER